jgi:hypothetical protein
MRESVRVPPRAEGQIFDDEITLPFRIVCERKDDSEYDREDRLNRRGGSRVESSDEESPS